jgi:hypothetical protein
VSMFVPSTTTHTHNCFQQVVVIHSSLPLVVVVTTSTAVVVVVPLPVVVGAVDVVAGVGGTGVGGAAMSSQCGANFGYEMSTE